MNNNNIPNISVSKYAEKYIETILGYFGQVENLDFLKTLENRRFLIETGFRTLTHVFQYNFIVTADIETAYYSSRKSYLYYLEYLDQMNKLTECRDFRHADAVSFVYSKSVISYTSNVTCTYISITESEKMAEFIRISAQLHILLWWSNPNIERYALMKKISLVDLSNLENLLEQMETYQKSYPESRMEEYIEMID
jgi:hypothetical protein